MSGAPTCLSKQLCSSGSLCGVFSMFRRRPPSETCPLWLAAEAAGRARWALWGILRYAASTADVALGRCARSKVAHREAKHAVGQLRSDTANDTLVDRTEGRLLFLPSERGRQGILDHYVSIQGGRVLLFSVEEQCRGRPSVMSCSPRALRSRERRLALTGLARPVDEVGNTNGKAHDTFPALSIVRAAFASIARRGDETASYL